MAGIDDNFALHADPAFPSDAFVAAVSGAVQDFDLLAGFNGGSSGHHVAHTFSDLPPGIIDATLEMRVQGGFRDLVSTDHMLLSFVTPGTTDYYDAIAYDRFFGPFAGNADWDADPGLFSSWNYGSVAYITLDLSALPLEDGGTLDLIPQLNNHGFLDVDVQDETGADFYRLTYTVPEPSTDFDEDGDVDGNDFLFWQRNPSVGLLADWEAQYGAVAPLSAASTAVPEPSSLLLGALASIGLMLRRKRCRWVAFGVFGSWIETAEVRHRRTLATCDWTCRWGHPQREPRSSHSDW